ncbi:MAG TPA: hypothetical protein VGC96_14090 [Candidatus Elarobacter sp.]
MSTEKVVETKETTVEKHVVHEEPAVEKRTVVEERHRPETITIETHTEG